MSLDRAAVSRLLLEAGLPESFDAAVLAGGRNNRVYRLDGAGGPAVLKCYFRHAGDTRDRLGAEWAFSNFAWQAGIRAIARPLAADAAAHLALFEFLPGRRIAPSEVDAAMVAQAAALFTDLNVRRGSAQGMEPASEACFCFADHLAVIERRIARLQALVPVDATGRELADFLGRRLVPAWRDAARHVSTQAQAAGVALDDMLAAGERCVSPSDFGFHNALMDDNNRTRFVDFEYAGWDDPAKTVADFFNQVAVPVPMAYYPIFASAVEAVFGGPGPVWRAKVLLPLYRVKWCCIILNEFLAVDRARREFSAADTRDNRARQLALAGQLLDRMEEAYNPEH